MVPLLILDGGNGHGNAQQAPVLAHARRLVVVYTLSPANALHDLTKFIRLSGGKRRVTGWPTMSWALIAVHAFCCGIPTGDYAVQIFTQNGIIGRGDNGSQVKTRLLCPPAVGDVAEGALKHLVSIGLKQGTHPLDVAGIAAGGG